jgi:hypothetical protein
MPATASVQTETVHHPPSFVFPVSFEQAPLFQFTDRTNESSGHHRGRSAPCNSISQVTRIGPPSWARDGTASNLVSTSRSAPVVFKASVESTSDLVSSVENINGQYVSIYPICLAARCV